MADNKDNFVPNFEEEHDSGPPTPPVLPDHSDVSAYASESVKSSSVPDFSEPLEVTPIERFEQSSPSDGLFVPAFSDDEISPPTPQLVSINDLLDSNSELSQAVEEAADEAIEEAVEAPGEPSPPAPTTIMSEKKPVTLPEPPEDENDVRVRVFFAPGGQESRQPIPKPEPPPTVIPPGKIPPPTQPETLQAQSTSDLPGRSGSIEDANETRPEWEPFGIDLPAEQPESLIPSQNWEEKSSPPTGDYPELKREIRRESARHRLKISPAVVFIASALATLVLLGGGLLAIGYLTANLPPQAEEVVESGLTLLGIEPRSAASGAPDIAQTPETGIIIEPNLNPTSTATPEETTEPTVTPTPSPTDTPEPTDSEPSIIVLNDNQIEQNGTVMVYVPEGSFQMGSGSAAHTITLDAYYIDQTEVTNRQWRDCVDAGACELPASTDDYAGDPYYGVDELDEYPVINVSWNQANDYCLWREARLPTEAEWEKAARWDPDTESEQSYPWGNDWDPARLNSCDLNCPLSDDGLVSDDGWAQTAPVGSFPDGASPVGALDMAGNVSEWVNDWYADGYYTISPESNPTGPDNGTQRVVRGGAWGVSDSRLFLSSIRSRFEPQESGPGTGFRCAISASDIE